MLASQSLYWLARPLPNTGVCSKYIFGTFISAGDPVRIEYEACPSEETLGAVRAGMRRYVESRVAWEEYRDLTFVARADDGSVIGAALGETGRGWLRVSVVWVTESSRNLGLGTQLVNAMEA